VCAAIVRALAAKLNVARGSLQAALERAGVEYRTICNELLEMARYPDDDNPYIDRSAKREYALRARVRIGDTPKRKLYTY
jgi:hypothetical protein